MRMGAPEAGGFAVLTFIGQALNDALQRTLASTAVCQEVGAFPFW